MGGKFVKKNSAKVGLSDIAILGESV